MLWGIALIACGLYCVVGLVIFNIGMNTRKAQSMVKLIGLKGTKIFYTAIGAFCIIYGLVITLG